MHLRIDCEVFFSVWLCIMLIAPYPPLLATIPTMLRHSTMHLCIFLIYVSTLFARTIERTREGSGRWRINHLGTKSGIRTTPVFETLSILCMCVLCVCVCPRTCICHSTATSSSTAVTATNTTNTITVSIVATLSLFRSVPRCVSGRACVFAL